MKPKLKHRLDSKTGKLKYAYISFPPHGQVTLTEELDEGRIFVDYDKDGRILGIEILSTDPL
jgi:uncharacterized protein YuzE